jgi:hypothetical protein
MNRPLNFLIQVPNRSVGQSRAKKGDNMDLAAWNKNKLLNSIQSAMLVVSLAAILGLVGWMLSGHLFALSAVAAIIVLYFFAPKMSPFLILKMLRGRRLSYQDTPRLYQVCFPCRPLPQ